MRQSQFSRQLRDLGQFFEVDLTRRRGKGAELTPAGRELAALGREILRALNDYRSTQGASGRTIRLGAGESLIQWHVLPHLNRLREELPGAVISLRNLRGADVLAQIAESQLDFGLVAVEELPSGLEATRLGTLRYKIYLHSAQRRKIGAGDWRKAMRLPLVGLEGDGDLMRKIRKVADEHEIPLRPAVQCSSLPGVAAALRDIEGFAILPEAAARDGIESLEAPFLREFDRTIRLVWSRRRIAIKDDVGRWRRKLVSVLSW